MLALRGIPELFFCCANIKDGTNIKKSTLFSVEQQPQVVPWTPWVEGSKAGSGGIGGTALSHESYSPVDGLALSTTTEDSKLIPVSHILMDTHGLLNQGHLITYGL
jgi:hypothetical protein